VHHDDALITGNEMPLERISPLVRFVGESRWQLNLAR
jgi:hypothetical protein